MYSKYIDVFGNNQTFLTHKHLKKLWRHKKETKPKFFYSEKINDIIDRAIQRARDCPNDPICEAEHGHCFACVDIPETACEQFNTKLGRDVFNEIIV